MAQRPSPDLVRLEAGPLSLDLSPRVGGAVAAFRHERTDILRPADEEALAKGPVRRFSSYPLVPYSNRIAHGRFSFRGTTHQLTLNFGDHPHSLHGNAWQREWTLDSASETEAVLSLTHDPFGFGPAGWDGWPYRYHARQEIALDHQGVRFAMSVENRGETPMPAGLGWHPYFARVEGMELSFAAKGVWLNGEDALPSEAVPVPAKWDYATARPLGEPQLDNCFFGWSGRARLVLPRHGLSIGIEAEPECRHLVVYVPAGKDYLALEPVTHMNDAINRMESVGDHGLRVLEPGERFETAFRLSVVTT